MKIVSLVDNVRLPERGDLRAEAGLSICVVTDRQRILFDTGISGAFLRNAERLNVDIAGITLAVLSHHHFDHGGGLAAFFGANARAPVYLRRGATERLYLHLFGLVRRRVGLDESLFRQYPRRFVFVDGFSEIEPDVFILTAIGTRHPTPEGNRRLFVHDGRASRLDDFEHELILVVRERGALVVFTGCSHHGILNMLDSVLEHFPGHAINAVVGGFHLIDLPVINSLAGSPADVGELGRALLRYPVQQWYTGHCTGRKAFRILRAVMGAKLQYLATGCRVEV